jgi:hypothetical protein
MNGYAFNPKRGPIIVRAEATGPNGTTTLNLALDTAATMSVIKISSLLYLGFDINQPNRRTQMATGSAVASVRVFVLTRFGALGQNQFLFPVIGHTPPSGSGIDGLLGLDFLRDQVLTIDFRSGQISLT